MILKAASGGIVLLLLLAGSVEGQDDDSLASTFLSGKNHIYDYRLLEIWKIKNKNVILVQVCNEKCFIYKIHKKVIEFAL